MTLESAIEHAASLTIVGHPHTGQNPSPPFPSEEKLAAAAQRQRKQRTVICAPVKQRTTTLKPQYLQASSEDWNVSLQPIAWPCNKAVKPAIELPNAAADNGSAIAAALLELRSADQVAEDVAMDPLAKPGQVTFSFHTQKVLSSAQLLSASLACWQSDFKLDRNNVSKLSNLSESRALPCISKFVVGISDSDCASDISAVQYIPIIYFATTKSITFTFEGDSQEGKGQRGYVTCH